MMRLIFNGILLLTSVVIIFAYAKPVYEAPDTGIVALQEKKEVLIKARADLGELDKKQKAFLAKSKEISQVDLERLERLLPREINPVLFVMELDTIAKEQGMSLKNIKFADAKKDAPTTPGAVAAAAKKPYETFTLSFDVTGPYANFIIFLEQIEKGLRVTDVTSITLVANDKVDVYQYAVKAQTYWMK